MHQSVFSAGKLRKKTAPMGSEVSPHGRALYATKNANDQYDLDGFTEMVLYNV